MFLRIIREKAFITATEDNQIKFMFLKIIRKKAFITAIEDNKIVLLRLNDILFCLDKTSIT